MSVKVKICGLTSLPDAKSAVEAGADILGFVFWDQSPRRISLAAAAEVMAGLPPEVVKAGVFVNASPDEVFQAIHACNLNILQFHGDEPPGYCLQFGLMTVKAFRVRDASSLERLKDYPTDAWLLDAYSAGKPGGTGEHFNWDLAVLASQRGRPIMLAGGLTPENVAVAVRKVRPFAVDVSSGVESSPGKKDPAKIRAFISAAKSQG
jgi:phosphoribosylanthranilate isomerase